MNPPEKPAGAVDPERLLEDQRWMHALARGLLGDEHAAEDVAQETRLRAWQHPPRDRERAGAWLRRIARNVALRMKSRNERRAAREVHAATPIAQPATDELVARVQMQRALADAVLALDEPYRTAVLMRYFDDLPPRAIAERLGAPVETVRTRLKRALEQLRARLDREFGARDSWALVLAPWFGVGKVAVSVGAAGSGAAATTTMTTSAAAGGFVTMSIGAKLSLMGALGLAGLAAWYFTRAATPSGATLAGAAPIASNASATSSSDTAPPAAKATAEPAADRPSRIPSGDLLLSGFVADAASQLIENASIRWDDPAADAHSNDRGSTNTGAPEGEYAILGLAPRPTRFHVSAPGCQELDVALDLTAGGELRHDFVLARSFLIPYRIVRSDGTPLLRREPKTAELGEFQWSMAVVASDTVPQLPPIQSARYESFGIGHVTPRRDFTRSGDSTVPEGMDGIVDLPHLPVEISLLFRHVVMQHQRVTASGEVVSFTVDPDSLEPYMGRIVGRVVDERGAPLRGAHVGIEDMQRGGGSLPVGEDGRFERGPLRPGFVDLVVSSGDRSGVWRTGYRAWKLVEPGKTLDVGDIPLEPGIQLEGTLLGVDGKPRKGMVAVRRQDLVVHGLPFGSSNFWGMDEPGRLVIPNLGRHRYALIAGPDADDGGGEIAAYARVEITGPDPSPIVMQLAPTVEVSFFPHLERDEFLMAELRHASIGTLHAVGWHGREGWSERVLPGGYVLSLYDGARLAREVAFDVGIESLRIEFSAHDREPAKITPVAAPVDGAVANAGAKDAVKPAAALGDRKLRVIVLGTVVDRAGAPVAHATVSLLDPDGKGRWVDTNAKGEFTLAGLRQGVLDLTARADGCREIAERVTLLDGEPPHRLELVLERATRIHVHLRDPAGAPLKRAMDKKLGDFESNTGLRVVATIEAPPATLPRNYAEVGHWQEWGMRHDADGVIDVREPLPVFLSVVFANQVLASEELAEPKEELTLVADPSVLDASLATVRFRLIDAESGEPILRAGAEICAPNTWGQPPLKDLAAVSDGVWTFNGIAPGLHNLCLNIEGLQNGAARKIEVVGGRLNDLGEVEILRDTELRGRLVDESGRSVTASLMVTTAGIDERGGSINAHSVKVEDDGRFVATVSAPRVRIRAQGDWARDPIVVDVLHAASTDLVITLRRGTLVTLRPRPGARDARHVEIVRADGEPLFDWTLDGPAPQRVRLVPGTYKLVVEKDGAKPEERSFTVGGSAMDVDLGS